MGFAHVLGLDDGGERFLCRSCGRFVTIQAGDDPVGDGQGSDDAADRRTVETPDETPECPNCGSRDLRRLALL